MKPAINRKPSLCSMRRQRGVSILIALIALVILLFSGMALIRSFDTSMTMAGNLSFKRDLVNRSELGIKAALLSLSASGTLASTTTRENNQVAFNYSSTVLSSSNNNFGIPNALVDDSVFSAAGTSATNDIVDSANAVTIRYLIDRQCRVTGPSSDTECTLASWSTIKAGGSGHLANKQAGNESKPVYRISVRVIGPRGTVAYVQQTVTL